MDMVSIEHEIEKRRQCFVHENVGTKTQYNIRSFLSNWLHTGEIQENIHILEGIERQINIYGKLYIDYDLNWKRVLDFNVLLEEDYEMLVLLLAQYINQQLILNMDKGYLLKKINTLYKILDCIQSPLFKEGILYKTFKNLLDCVCDLPMKTRSIEKHTHSIAQRNEQEIPLTVLFYEGPIARAYLATLRSLRLKPRKIIHIVPKHDVVTKRTLGRFFPKKIRLAYASSIHAQRMHFWSKKIGKTHPEIKEHFFDQVSQSFGFDVSILNEANTLYPLNKYTDSLSKTCIQKLGDLADFFEHSDGQDVLYTGGGIVPKSLLNIEDLNMIHIHPGFLPDIRGADGTLWSLLLTGHCSASCFYMNEGLDTGDVILNRWLPKISLLKKVYPRELAYRSVYTFLDPWVRSYVLKEVLVRHKIFLPDLSVAQDCDQGVTYHFMHRSLQDRAMKISNEELA